MRFDTMSIIDVPPGDDPVGQRAPAVQKTRDTIEQFVASEAMGFEGAWISEHHFGAESVSAAMPVLLATIAARTERLRVGSAISVLPLSNPIRQAEDYATVDVLSGGRLDFGVGVGNRARETMPFGIAPEECRERFYEAYEVITRCWTEDIVDFRGKFYEANAVTLLPKPVQEPLPPIYQPVQSPDTMDWVAEQGIIPMHAGNPDRIRGFQERYRASLEDAGKTDEEIQDAIDKIYWQVFTHLEPSHVSAQTNGPRHHAEWFNTALRADDWGAVHLGLDLDSPYALKSTGSALIWEDPDSAWNARQSMSGDPQYAIDWITELKELGVKHLTFLCSLGTTTHDESMQTLRLLSDEVLPHFK